MICSGLMIPFTILEGGSIFAGALYIHTHRSRIYLDSCWRRHEFFEPVISAFPIETYSTETFESLWMR